MVYLLGDLVPLLHRQVRTHRDIHLGQEAVAQPPYPDLGDLFHAVGCIRYAPDLVNHLWFHAVQEAGDHGLARLQHDPEYRHGNHHTDYRVGQWEAQPNPHRAEQHRKAGQPVYPGVETVGHQGGAANFLAYFYSK